MHRHQKMAYIVMPLDPMVFFFFFKYIGEHQPTNQITEKIKKGEDQSH